MLMEGGKSMEGICRKAGQRGKEQATMPGCQGNVDGGMK